jgi:sugar O-acyltransferase (sialic acid O-acetyltransferase NeuD family)
MNLPIIVLCAGGHSKVLVNILLDRNEEIIGVVDQDPAKHGTLLLGIPVIGNDKLVLAHAPNAIRLVNGLGSAQSLKRRRALFEKFSACGYHFASVIHPSVTIGREVILGEGVQLMASVTLQPGVSIGADAIINTAATADHDCRIGAHTHVAPGAVLCGGVQIGDEVHLGSGSTVIQNMRIGDGSLIAAGAVVTCDLHARSRVAGIPAKEIGP